MARTLVGVTGVETIKTLVACLAVPNFTIDELAQQAGVSRRTVDTVVRRYQNAFDRLPGDKLGGPGRPPVRWSLRTDHLDEVLAAVDAHQSALGAGWRSKVADTPEPDTAEASLVMAAAAITRESDGAEQAKQLIATARNSLAAAGFGSDGSPWAEQPDQKLASRARFIAAIADVVDACLRDDQQRIDETQARAMPHLEDAKRYMPATEWIPLARRVLLAPGTVLSAPVLIEKNSVSYFRKLFPTLRAFPRKYEVPAEFVFMIDTRAEQWISPTAVTSLLNFENLAEAKRRWADIPKVPGRIVVSKNLEVVATATEYGADFILHRENETARSEIANAVNSRAAWRVGLLGEGNTSWAHIARLELKGSPVLTPDQHDRLERAGDVVRLPFGRAEMDELYAAMHTARASTVEQADRAVQGIAGRAGQIFAPPGERERENAPETAPNPFAAGSRPRFLTGLPQVLAALQDDIEHLIRDRPSRRLSRGGAEPDLILAWFARNLVDEAEDPEDLRENIREFLRRGGTVEILMAPAAEEAAEDLVALVPPMIAYIGQGGQRYRVHVIDEPKHPLAYDICVADDRGLLISRSGGDHTAAVRTNDRHDVDALRDLLRPYWKDKESIIEEAGRRTKETVAGHSSRPSVALPFERLLTSVEVEEGSRRLVKKGLSILNIPVAIHAWKWRAAELCTAGWIPGDLLEILQAQAGELANQGLRQLPSAVLDTYTQQRKVRKALRALEGYARGLHRRQAAWTVQLSRHQFWDACPKSAIRNFISTGELPPDEIPPACEYRAERSDIETIITQLIIRLRSSRNYHLALIDDDQPFPQWFYFGVKEAHVLAQVFGNPQEAEGNGKAAQACDDMLNIHIHSAPIAEAFADWFDEHVLKTAIHPAWQENRDVADWLEGELQEHGRSG